MSLFVCGLSIGLLIGGILEFFINGKRKTYRSLSETTQFAQKCVDE